MNRKWTIKAKIWALSGFLLATLLGVSVVNEVNSIRLVDELKDLANVHMPAVRSMTLADMMHDGIRANVYGAIVAAGTKDKEKIAEITGEREEFAKNIQEHIENLGRLDLPDETKQAIAPAIPKIEAYVASANEIVTTALSGDSAGAMAKLPEFDKKFTALEESLEALGELIENNAKEAQVGKVASAESARRFGFVLMILGLVVGSLFAFLFIAQLQKTLREMIGKLSDESNSVDNAANSLQGTSRRLSESAVKQASALQETASCVEEITAMVNKTAENSRHLELSATETNASAVRGKKSMEEVLSAIADIQNSQADINGQVTTGNQKITEIVKVISEIGQKTKVINDIVFQTKLLSFNASVEAARAGEHGKGFAVVAEEVGNLAQMSGNAAKEISDMLANGMSRANEIVTDNRNSIEALIQRGKAKIEVGVGVAQSCGAALEEIVKQVAEESRLIGEITTAIREQNQGIHEISKAIQLLDTSTQENASMSTGAAGLSESLLTRASTLAGMVTEMRVLIEGQNEKAMNERAATPSQREKKHFKSAA